MLYLVIAEPPLDVDAVIVRVTCLSPATPVGAAGVAGVVAGVIELEALDGFDVPTELVAETLKKYEVPLVRPVTVQVPAEVSVEQVPADTGLKVPEGEFACVMLYPVIRDPPFDVGAVIVNITWVLPAMPVGALGVEGALMG
jgi:hypothetical protein